MEVGGMLPSHSQEEISPIKEGDYVGEDGLIRCGVCGKRKQFKIEISGFRKIVPCICKCRSDEIEKEKQKDEYEQRMHAINRLKDASMMASKFRDANFSGYKVREENQEAYKLALNYVKKFREMKEKNQGLLLYGPVGTGKSFTAACIANALMEQNITVIMTSFVKILQDIGTGDEASYIQILNSAYKNEDANRYRVNFMIATEKLMDKLTVREFISYLEEKAEFEDTTHEYIDGKVVECKAYDLKEENSNLHKEFLVTSDGRVFYWRTLMDKIELIDEEESKQAPEKRARNLVRSLTTAQLLDQWEATTTMTDLNTPTLRGWFMDELEKRFPDQFDKWLDSDCRDEDLRKFIYA